MVSWLILVTTSVTQLLLFPVVDDWTIWQPTYRQALAVARQREKPLLIVLEDGRDLSRQFGPLKSNHSGLVKLLSKFQVCQLDVRTKEGRRVANIYGARAFPYVLITDTACENIVFRGSGQFSTTNWATTVATFSGRPAAPVNQPTAPAQRSDRSNPQTTQGENAVVELEARSLDLGRQLDEAQEAAQKSNKPLFAFVTTSSCYHCERMKKETLADSEVVASLGGSFETVAVHSDERPEWVQRHGVRMFPTVLILGHEDRLIDRIEGFVTAEELMGRVDRVDAPFVSALW